MIELTMPDGSKIAVNVAKIVFVSGDDEHETSLGMDRSSQAPAVRCTETREQVVELINGWYQKQAMLTGTANQALLP